MFSTFLSNIDQTLPEAQRTQGNGIELNDLFDYIEFVFNLAEEVTQVLDSIAWVRCASGNVSL